MGDTLQVLRDAEDEGWYVARNAQGKEGLVPATHVTEDPKGTSTVPYVQKPTEIAKAPTQPPATAPAPPPPQPLAPAPAKAAIKETTTAASGGTVSLQVSLYCC